MIKYEITDADLILIGGCLVGDESAWEALIKKYERLIYAVCKRNSLYQDEADDIFSRVCLLILQNLEKLRDYSRLVSWITTTTNRECWQLKKNAQALSNFSRPGGTGKLGLEEIQDYSPLPEEELLRLERQQNVREAFNSLPETCQKLLWQLFYNPEEPDYNTISEAISLPVASIGPNRQRCLNRLRGYLERNIKNWP